MGRVQDSGFRVQGSANSESSRADSEETILYRLRTTLHKRLACVRELLFVFKAGGFHPGSQYFGHAPRLGDPAAGMIWRLGVEDFAYRAQAGVIQMRPKTGEQPSCIAGLVGVDPQPGTDILT